MRWRRAMRFAPCPRNSGNPRNRCSLDFATSPPAWGDTGMFIYRHWPLPYHRYAFDAARAAECAGLQGRFWEFHDRLLRDSHWIHDAFVRFAAEAGVADLERFRQCALSDEVDAFIRHDAALAASLDSNGTPVLIVNGVLLAATPDTAELAAILATARDRRDQR